MAKIKLSALVSDIKGKVNGSVFARNSGGVYFRNNPSGGGRDSIGWSKVRSRFASTASSWRNLSTEEREAWNSAKNSYNTKGAFGDVRLPSGYELFVRVNQTLKANGLGPIRVPIEPVALPDLTRSVMYSSSERFLNPNNFFVTNAGFPLKFELNQSKSTAKNVTDDPFFYAQKTASYRNDLYSSSANQRLFALSKLPIMELQPHRLKDYIVFGGSIVVSDRSAVLIDGADVIPLTSQFVANGFIRAFLARSNDDTTILKVDIKGSSNDIDLVFDIGDCFYSPLINYVVNIDFDNPLSSFVFVNGIRFLVNESKSSNDTHDISSIRFNPIPIVENEESVIGYNASFLDTYNDGDMIGTDLCFGYYPTTLLNQMFYNKSENSLVHSVKLGRDNHIDLTDIYDNNALKPSFMPFLQNPIIFLDSDFDMSDDWLLVLKSSRPTSVTRIGASDDFNVIARFVPSKICGTCIVNGIYEKFGSWVYDSTLRFSLHAINKYSGQATPDVELEFKDWGPILEWGDAHWEGYDCPDGYIFVDGYCFNTNTDWGSLFNSSGGSKKKPKFKPGAGLSETAT